MINGKDVARALMDLDQRTLAHVVATGRFEEIGLSARPPRRRKERSGAVAAPDALPYR